MSFSIRGRTIKTLTRKEALESGASGGFVEVDYMAERESGILNFDLIPLEKIQMDPDNPRTRGIDPAPLVKRMPGFLVIDPNHELYDQEKIEAFDASMMEGVEEVIESAPEEHRDRIRKFFTQLIPLRDNIRLIRVKQPIEVHEIHEKRRTFYRIVYGHRRYLASLLAGELGIPARIVLGDGSDKLAQASENIMQESLSLAQRLDMFRQLVDAVENGKRLSSRKLAEKTGYHFMMISRFRTVVDNACKELLDAINGGLLNSLKKAAEVAALPRKKQVDFVTALRQGEASPKLKSKHKSKRGRVKSVIKTPNITDASVVRYLLQRLGVEEADAKIDWSDLKAVETLWVEVIERIIKERKEEGS